MPGFKELEERKEAFVYTAGEVVIYKNIYHEGAYVGRLSLLIEEGQSEEKTEYEKAVFNHLAGYVEQLYDQCGGFELGSPRLADLHHMMKKCLETDGADEGELLRLLWANKNLPGDVYYMLTIRENILQRGKAYNMRYLCSQMERMWPGAYCVTHNGDIAMLFNRNMFSKSTGSGISQGNGVFSQGECAGSRLQPGVHGYFLHAQRLPAGRVCHGDGP
ncbi:hypothetical protein LC724_09820 [Blautia sp. RD014234]|nr:hypothetical protein [Blautia parvula]